MRKGIIMKTIAFTIIASAAGLALSNPISVGDRSDPFSHGEFGSGTTGIITTIDLTGIQFNDVQGSALNEVLTLIFPPAGFVDIIGIGWDISLTTIGASWASDATIGFEDQIFFTPGEGDSFSVINANYSSPGILDLTDNGFSDIHLTGDLTLDIEFFDTFVDNGGTGDAFFEPGSVLYIQYIYPTPGTLGALGLGGLIATRRKRSTP